MSANGVSRDPKEESMKRGDNQWNRAGLLALMLSALLFAGLACDDDNTGVV